MERKIVSMFPLSLYLCGLCDLCGRVLSDIRQPVSRLAAHVIDQAVGLARISSLVEHIVRLAPRDLQNFLVAHDVGDAERGDARLAGAHHLARASNLQILFGDLEAVRGLFHYLQPLARLLGLLKLREQNAETLRRSAPNPPA